MSDTDETPEAPEPPPEVMVRRGRRGSLTPQVMERVIQTLQVGMGMDDSFRSAGIGVRTGFDWLERGRKARAQLLASGSESEEAIPEAERPYLLFLEEVEEAQLVAKERLITLVTNDAIDNVESAKWMLGKKFPREFGDRVQVTIDEELAGFLEDARSELAPEVFEAVLRVAVRRLGGEAAEAVAVDPDRK